MGNSEWIPASIKPEQTAKGTFCLIERNGKLYPETCYYFNKHQQDFCPDGNEDWADFENDEYYLPEGWYTLCDQCEKYWKVDVSFYMIGLDYPVINSHSPTEPEFDTLQEGDWFEGSPDQYRKVLEFEGTLKEDAYDDFIEDCVNHGMVWQTEFGNGYIDNLTCYFKTQLTPEEFLRRAENTFKTK